MLESAIQRSIRNYLKKEGWIVIKIIMAGENGWPDLLAIKDGRVLFIEVKQPGKDQEPLQQIRQKQLMAAGVESIVIRSLPEIKEKIKEYKEKIKQL